MEIEGGIGDKEEKSIDNRWLDLEYLRCGDSTQADVYQLLVNYRIFQILRNYQPILVGTVPIGIPVETSDLDIICSVQDFNEFERLNKVNFGIYKGFSISRRTVEGIERVKINFTIEKWPIEIFGQNKPTLIQNGFLHMVIEERLLRLFGNKFKEYIIHLKSNGIKTEPAFAKALNIQGDPYLELLSLNNWSDAELRGLWVDPDGGFI